MATTTRAAIREAMLDRLEQNLTPAVHSTLKLRRWREESAFRPWALANPTGCTRRVSVRFLGSTEPPAVNDTLVQEVRDTAEVVVAYAKTFRFGGEQLAGLDEAIDNDERLIEAQIGPPGYAAFAGLVAPCTVMSEQPSDREGKDDDTSPVVFLVLRYRVDFFRSLS